MKEQEYFKKKCGSETKSQSMCTKKPEARSQLCLQSDILMGCIKAGHCVACFLSSFKTGLPIERSTLVFSDYCYWLVLIIRPIYVSFHQRHNCTCGQESLGEARSLVNTDTVCLGVHVLVMTSRLETRSVKLHFGAVSRVSDFRPCVTQKHNNYSVVTRALVSRIVPLEAWSLKAKSLQPHGAGRWVVFQQCQQSCPSNEVLIDESLPQGKMREGCVNSTSFSFVSLCSAHKLTE